VIVAYIDAHKDRFGVDPICRVLTKHGMAIAPSTYYAHRSAPVSAAELADAYAANAVLTCWRANRGVYGVRKLWHALRREGHQMGRDQVGRLMAIVGISGAIRGEHRTRTTRRHAQRRPPPGPGAARLARADPARPVVGGRLHLRVDARRVRLRRVPDRRVLPPHPGLASQRGQEHRPGVLRAGASAVHPPPGRRHLHRPRPDPPLRRGVAVHVVDLHRRVARGRHQRLDRQRRRRPGQRPSSSRPSGCSRPSSSPATAAPGAAAPSSSERRPRGSTGTTPHGFTAALGTAHPWSSRSTTIPTPTSPQKPRWPDRSLQRIQDGSSRAAGRSTCAAW
jgi:hypothetical protein